METLLSTAGAGARVIPDALAPGTKAGPWLVEGELGSGGMGTVYAVVHAEIGKRAALKVVHRRYMQGLHADRMLVEARVVNEIRHPNIVDIFETGHLADGRPYIVMERLEGQSLSQRADERKLLPDQVIGILLQICEALSAAHAAGIVHRDLKLDNIFLVDNPEDRLTPRAIVLDWGIAKRIDDDVSHTQEGTTVGTPQYLSPEQARGAAVTAQTDVYSLGVMAYELFLEQLPFEADSVPEVMAMHLRSLPPPPRDIWPEIPRALEELLEQMLAKVPSARPTIDEVALRLVEVKAELRMRCLQPRRLVPQPSPQLPPPVTRVAEEAPRSQRWKLALGAVALAGNALFLLAHTDSTPATAASVAPAIAAPAIEAPAPIAPSAPAPVVRELCQLPPAVANPPAQLVEQDHGETDIPHEVRPMPQVRPVRATPAPVHARLAPRPAATAPREPAAPHRIVALDANGTLDPYR